MSNLALVQTEKMKNAPQLRPVATETFVRTVGVQKSYAIGDNEVFALRGVTLDLARGEFVALCGTSGSGKTTLLNLIGCLDMPTAGEIVIGGQAVNRLNDSELAHFRATQLGFVFQTFNLIPVLSAVENVEYPLLRKNLSARQRREVALGALAKVGLEKFASHRPDELSGGQRQRVAIARAFVHGPELIIADEPTANLDSKTAAGILDLLGELNLTLGITIVVATHDPRVVERTDRTVHIVDGLLTHEA